MFTFIGCIKTKHFYVYVCVHMLLSVFTNMIITYVLTCVCLCSCRQPFYCFLLRTISSGFYKNKYFFNDIIIRRMFTTHTHTLSLYLHTVDQFTGKKESAITTKTFNICAMLILFLSVHIMKQ
jgi:hypothetical protein